MKIKSVSKGLAVDAEEPEFGLEARWKTQCATGWVNLFAFHADGKVHSSSAVGGDLAAPVTMIDFVFDLCYKAARPSDLFCPSVPLHPRTRISVSRNHASVQPDTVPTSQCGWPA